MLSRLQSILRKLLGSYKLTYKISYAKFLINKFVNKDTSKSEQYDLIFVVHEMNKGWILEAICKEIAVYFPGKYCFHYSTFDLPPSKAYFFTHYSLFPACIKLNPSLWDKSKSLVFYTHPKEMMNGEELIYILRQSTKVMSMCSQYANLLVECGLPAEKVTCVLGAADPEVFQPHQRSSGAVGFCTAYHARKEPDRILNIIKLLPHRKFILIGRNWSQYERFAELIALPNLHYVEVTYANYPIYYAQMDVFVSPASLEGGPIPLIEAMMSNIVPVASKAGFAPDIITHGDNGFLFDVDSPAEVVCELIEQAFQVTGDIRQTVKHLTWKNFSLTIQKLLK